MKRTARYGDLDSDWPSAMHCAASMNPDTSAISSRHEIRTPTEGCSNTGRNRTLEQRIVGAGIQPSEKPSRDRQDALPCCDIMCQTVISSSPWRWAAVARSCSMKLCIDVQNSERRWISAWPALSIEIASAGVLSRPTPYRSGSRTGYRTNTQPSMSVVARLRVCEKPLSVEDVSPRTSATESPRHEQHQ